MQEFELYCDHCHEKCCQDGCDDDDDYGYDYGYDDGLDDGLDDDADDHQAGVLGQSGDITEAQMVRQPAAGEEHPVFPYFCIPVGLYSRISVFPVFLYPCIPVFLYFCISVFLFFCIPVFQFFLIFRISVFPNFPYFSFS